MASKNLDVRIKNKYDDIDNYKASNIVLLEGEIAFGKDENYYVLYVGDGVTAFNDLTPLYSTQYKEESDSSINNINNNITNLNTTITNMNTNISKNTDDITAVSGEVSSLKNDVSEISDGVNVITTDVTTLKTDVNTLKSDMTTVKGQASQLETKIEDLDEKIDQSLTSAYKAAGNIDNISELPTADAEHLGYVYNINDSFTTTVDFIEGAGVSIPAGSNVAIVEIGENTYKYDVIGSFVDLSDYYNKTQINETTNTLQTSITKNANDITTANNNIASLNGEVTSLKSDVEDLNTQVETNTTNITSVTTVANNAKTLAEAALSKTGGTMTGTLTLSETPVATSNDKTAATTAFVKTAVSGKVDASSLNNYAPLASPALTGTPTAPTATAGTNTTQVATTAFVKAAIDANPGGTSVLLSATQPTGQKSGDIWLKEV